MFVSIGFFSFLGRFPRPTRLVHTAQQRHILITVALTALSLVFILSTFPRQSWLRGTEMPYYPRLTPSAVSRSILAQILACSATK